MTQEPAVVVIRPDGTYLDANARALDLLGVTLEELRASTPERFAAEPADAAADEAFRTQWTEAGQPDIGGAVTIRRADGTRRRVRFVISRREEDRFVALLEPLDEPTSEPPVVFTAGRVLAEWRAAERRLTGIPADSAEWQDAVAQIESLRERYHRLFEARRGQPPR